MKKGKEKAAVPQGLSPEMSAAARSRFDSFCTHILGTDANTVPSQESIFMKQSLSIVFHATLLFLLTNGFYIVKNFVQQTLIVIDMVPLYMMTGASLAMLIFLLCCKKYGSRAARFALLAFYTVIIASVTVFMVSCNYHSIGLSISMCYLFIIMIAPTYPLSDTIFICILIFVSWWLPGKLPYAENYNLFKHFLLRFAVVAGFIVVRAVFLRQAADERRVSVVSNSYIKLAYNDIMTGTLNKKALEAYQTFLSGQTESGTVSVIICDIDDFKSYNDHYSHIRGDEALRQIAAAMVDVLAASDRYLFRFGGEEFVVILPGVAEEEACRTAAHLLAAVRAAAIPREDVPGRSIVTASFGVASGTVEELGDLSILAKADRQLYICKNGGKDRVAAGGTLFG